LTRPGQRKPCFGTAPLKRFRTGWSTDAGGNKPIQFVKGLNNGIERKGGNRGQQPEGMGVKRERSEETKNLVLGFRDLRERKIGISYKRSTVGSAQLIQTRRKRSKREFKKW